MSLGLAVLLASVAAGIPAGPASAGSTICVGIVVDYGDARPGGGANSFCAGLPSGSSGADVLAARARALGRPQPTYRSDGLLCTIDGYPRDGSCGDPAPGGGYRYWSYWHKFPGASTWTYSAAGAAGFTVADGLLEGWAYQNGGPEGGRRPPAVSYPSVCRASASPSPRPSQSASRRPSPSTGPTVRPAPRPTHSPGPPTPGPTRSTGAIPAPPGATPTIPRSPASPPASSAPGRVSGTSPPVPVTPLASAEPPRRTPAGLPLATAGGLLLAAAIAAAAVVRARSGRR